MDHKEHWDTVYRGKNPHQMSWYAEHLTQSLQLIQELANLDSEIIDVGGGASTIIEEWHRTPAGIEQSFLYTVFRRTD